jgi:hypothetical protein
MNREQAKALLPFIQAFSEGKTIQSRCITGETPLWWDDNNPTFEVDDFDYRIKPEPKYRPFANAEECIEEMKKHVPFGWVKDKCSFYPIEMMGASFSKEYIKCRGIWFTSGRMFKDVTFLDGTPFGVKIEEDKQ